MKQNVVVVGLSRHAQFFGLPLPYTMAVAALTVIPFFLLKAIPWLLTGLLWYSAARIVTAIDPNLHTVLATMLRRTPAAIFRCRGVRRHV